jgi:hypothetical protein
MDPAACRPDRRALHGATGPLTAPWQGAYRDAAAGRYGAALRALAPLVGAAAPSVSPRS